MNRSAKIVLVCLFLFFNRDPANGQRAVERSILINPLESPHVKLNESERKWFTQTGGWGSFGNHLFSGDEDHAWLQQLGAYVEIYRWANRASLALTGHVEVVADKRNDVGFSPRAIFWEEGFLYTHRAGRSYLQLGYYHRCKHDVDNFRFNEERTLVFGSLLVRAILPVDFFSRNDALFAIQYDHYTITWEKRFPDPSFGQKEYLGDLISSLKASLFIRNSLGESSALYFDGYVKGIYLKDELQVNGMVRAEIGRETPAGQVRFGIHAEYLADNLVSVNAGSVLLAGVGIRLMSAGVFR